MSDIPLLYRTAYQWTGESESGEVLVGDMPVMPVGSPHDKSRYCPEHLLVVAAESCLANYVIVIASMSGLELCAYQSTAEGELLKEAKTGYRFKRILIQPEITVKTGKKANAERVLEKAHALCMVARALNCPVEVKAKFNTLD